MFFLSSDYTPPPMIAAVIVISLLTALVATEPDASERDKALEPAPPCPRVKK
jgi:hypothetical protein